MDFDKGAEQIFENSKRGAYILQIAKEVGEILQSADRKLFRKLLLESTGIRFLTEDKYNELLRMITGYKRTIRELETIKESKQLLI